jgi:hypothetical protein
MKDHIGKNFDSNIDGGFGLGNVFTFGLLLCSFTFFYFNPRSCAYLLQSSKATPRHLEKELFLSFGRGDYKGVRLSL